jgi:hypothetical protein
LTSDPTPYHIKKTFNDVEFKIYVLQSVTLDKEKRDKIAHDADDWIETHGRNICLLNLRK